MLSLRTRLFVVISLAVLLILAISVVLLLRSRSSKDTNNPDTTPSDQTGTPVSPNNGATGGTPTQPIGTTPAPVVKQFSPLEVEQAGVKQLAKIFIERYNTYSTDNNYDNIREVESMVTGGLWKRISGRLSIPAAPGPFVGVTTRAVSAELGGWDSATADVLVQTHQVTVKNGVTTQTYQGVKIFFLKQGSNWLIDKFEWQK